MQDRVRDRCAVCVRVRSVGDCVCVCVCGVQVIRETARFVRRGGGQVEILLRVKQSSNPLFGFLQPGHRLHPYYTWIVKQNPQVRV